MDGHWWIGQVERAMVDVQYGQDLRGFVVRDGGIACEDWEAFAYQSANLQKQPPHMGINPFTRETHAFENSNFFIIEDGAQIGLVVWEESECIGVAGERARVMPFIDVLCKALDATFEPLHPQSVPVAQPVGTFVRARKKALGIAGALVVSGAALYAYALFCVVDEVAHASLASRSAALGGRPLPAIVLGMGPRPSSPILDRADLALELFARGHVSMFVTSGGRGDDEREPESSTLKTALVRGGVPADRVLEESASTSTLENLRLSRALLAREHVTTTPVLVVTHAFHARRVRALAERIGMDVIVIGTRGERLDRRAYRTAREAVALLATWAGR